jgi:predicted RecA/RadA family phage recombinase
MALNEIYKIASELDFAVDSDVKSGDIVVIGAIVGVAQHDALEGADGDYYATLKLDGAFKFPTEAEFSVGDVAYVDATGAVVADDAETAMGHVIKVAGDQVVVRLVAAA